jgi:serine phosphatase RsbU (regulator of sigma subunit)
MPQRATLTVTGPDGAVHDVKVEDKALTLGRGSGNELSFPEDIGLSRQHLIIEWDGERLTVRDLGSKNGTSVNGVRISDKYHLKQGDKISASRVVLSYGAAAPAAPRTVIFEPSEPTQKLALSTGTVAISLKDLLKGEQVTTDKDKAQATFWSTPIQALVRAGRELTIRRPLPELFKVILDLGIEAVHADRGVLLTLENNDLVVQSSSAGEFRISTAVRDRVLQERTSLLIQNILDDAVLQQRQSIVFAGTQSLMAVPLQTDDRVIGLLYVDSVQMMHPFSSEDLNLLTVMANVAAIRIEHERLALVEEAERIHNIELQQAADIQRRHLPESAPLIPGLELAGHNTACRTIGGDYYDFLSYPDGRIGLMVADVAGKGLPASLLMMKLQAHTQSLAEFGLGPAEFMKRLNRSLEATCPRNRFITGVLVMVDPATGEVVFSNAGHNPPLLVRGDGSIEKLTDGGPVLGLLPNLPYSEERTRLQRGDILVLFSDGIYEAEDPAGQEFGEQQFDRLLMAECQKPVQEIIATVTRAVDDFTAGAPASDDRTLVIVRWLGPSEAHPEFAT